MAVLFRSISYVAGSVITSEIVTAIFVANLNISVLLVLETYRLKKPELVTFMVVLPISWSGYIEKHYLFALLLKIMP